MKKQPFTYKEREIADLRTLVQNCINTKLKIEG